MQWNGDNSNVQTMCRSAKFICTLTVHHFYWLIVAGPQLHILPMERLTNRQCFLAWRPLLDAMASCCASKGRWSSRKDKFTAHQKTHVGGNATFVKSVNRTKKGAIIGYCSLCTSAPMTLMKTWRMKRHLTKTFGQVAPSEGE